MSQQSGYVPIPFNEDVEPKDINIDELNDKIFTALRACNSHFGSNSDIYEPYREIMSDILLSMIDTHKSIRELLRQIENGSAVDAITLARSQIETLFTVVWLNQSIVDNARVYQKDAWSKLFVRTALQEMECAKIPRMVEFFSGRAQELLRKWAVAIEITGDDIKEGRTFVRRGMTGKRPGVLAEQVPTPKKILDALPGGPQKDVLERMYRIEYLHLCGFAHPGQLSGFARRALRTAADSSESRSIENFVQTHVLDPSDFNSSLSMICVATICCQGRTGDEGLVAKLMAAWEPYIDHSLEGKFVWEHWARPTFEALGVPLLEGG